MLNFVALQGRLTRDIELKQTQSQISVASFSIAVERNFGGEEKQTDFINCVAWRHNAEFIGKYFHKGDMIIVQGMIQQRNWEDKDGNKRTSHEVIVDRAYFGGSKKTVEQGSSQPDAYNPQFVEVDDDGDLPF